MAATTLLFDLDGTLWDSYPVYADALGRSPTDRDRVTADLYSGQSVIALGTERGFSRAKLVQAIRGRLGRDDLYPEALTVLEDLVDRGCALGMVTSLPGTLAIPMMEETGIGHFFQATVHAGNCRSRKPRPGPVLQALDALSSEPDAACFYCGDLPSDEQCATRAGISFAWASYGYGPAPEGDGYVRLNTVSDALDL